MALDSVRLLFLVNNRGVRHSMRTILENIGFRTIETVATVDEARRVLARDNTDMLVADSGVGATTVPKLISDIRYSELGCSPFISILAVVNEPRVELVHALVNAGVDEMVLAPLSAARVIARVDEMIERRKPFVVTSDYMGPDRRKAGQRSEGKIVPLIDVPNLVKLRLDDVLHTLQLEFTTRETLQDMNFQRVERNLEQLGWCVDRLQEDVSWTSNGELSNNACSHIRRIREVVEETLWRARKTSYGDCEKAFNQLEKLAQTMLGETDEVPEQTRHLFTQLIKVLLARVVKAEMERENQQGAGRSNDQNQSDGQVAC